MNFVIKKNKLAIFLGRVKHWPLLSFIDISFSIGGDGDKSLFLITSFVLAFQGLHIEIEGKPDLAVSLRSHSTAQFIRTPAQPGVKKILYLDCLVALVSGADRVGGPWRKRIRHGFLDKKEAILGWSHFISVPGHGARPCRRTNLNMILREEKEWKNKQLLQGQGDTVTVGGGEQYFSCKGFRFCFSGEDDPEAYSWAILQDPDSLKYSITRLTET